MEANVQQRFWSKVDKSGECWLWTGGRSHSHGSPAYGTFDVGGASVKAHRFAYELLVGVIPDGMQLDHLCFNKGCVNPEHLQLVTQKQNRENLVGAYSNSSTGERGIFERRGRYRVAVRHNGTLHHCGTYDTLDEAREVAWRKRFELFTHNAADRDTGLVT